jgi:hypothetical protein
LISKGEGQFLSGQRSGGVSHNPVTRIHSKIMKMKLHDIPSTLIFEERKSSKKEGSH